MFLAVLGRRVYGSRPRSRADSYELASGRPSFSLPSELGEPLAHRLTVLEAIYKNESCYRR
jgi:hypothetical protein